MAEETKPIVTLQDARLFDSYNSAEARKFETQAGTLRNGRVFIAPSTFQLGTKVTKATTFSMKRKTKLAPSNLNLGLFAAVSFKENAIISFYGGDYLIRSLCNKNPPILKKLNASNHLALVNKHRIVVGDNVAQFMDRDTVIDDSKQSRRAKEYYMYDKLPEDLKERFVDEEAYKEYRTMLMDLGAGLFINQPRQFVPEFRDWMKILDRKGVPKEKKNGVIQQLSAAGINCLMLKHIEQNLMDVNGGKSAEFIFFSALRDINPGEELISYYNCPNEQAHNNFFQLKDQMDELEPILASSDSDNDEQDNEDEDYY